MKKLGIWIDKNRALLVFIEGKKERLVEVLSNMDHFKIGGGSGTRFKGGPQDVVQDSKYLEREKHQLKDYFIRVAEKMKGVQSLAIFGPAQVKDKFYKELEDSYVELYRMVKEVSVADSMTENQVKALVRDFFN